MEKNKNFWIIITVLFIVAVLLFWAMNKSSAPAPGVDNNQPIDSAEDTSTGSINIGASATISYQNALVKYKDTRLELDATCEANPANMTVKNNTDIMVDNRAPTDRVITVGSTFNLKAYSFKIINISSETLPATWLVGCNQSQNVATILIQ